MTSTSFIPLSNETRLARLIAATLLGCVIAIAPDFVKPASNRN